jgi:hypothetical protein
VAGRNLQRNNNRPKFRQICQLWAVIIYLKLYDPTCPSCFKFTRQHNNFSPNSAAVLKSGVVWQLSHIFTSVYSLYAKLENLHSWPIYSARNATPLGTPASVHGQLKSMQLAPFADDHPTKVQHFVKFSLLSKISSRFCKSFWPYINTHKTFYRHVCIHFKIQFQTTLCFYIMYLGIRCQKWLVYLRLYVVL